MKLKLLISAIAVTLITSAFVLSTDDNPTLEIGAKAPLQDYQMKDVSGKEVSLKSLMNKNGVLVIFSCNTCPFVVGRQDSEGWEGRYNDVASHAKANGVTTVLVNPNEAKRDKGDSFDDMVKRAKDQKYNMYYALDSDHQLADAFGARTTPHVFLFNSDFTLVYKGAIDDNNDTANDVKEHWLNDALDNLAGGKEIDPNATRNIGCSIKRVKKG